MASSPKPLPLPLPLPPPYPPPQNPLPQSPDNPTPPPPPPAEKSTPPPPPVYHASPHSPPNDHLPLSPPPFSPSCLAIVLRSPDKPTNDPDQIPNSNNAPSAVTIGSLLATTDLTVAKVAATGGGSVKKSGLLAPNPWKFKRDELRRLELGLRVSALVLCVISFSLMAADTVPGWGGDSFIRYQEYRFLLTLLAWMKNLIWYFVCSSLCTCWKSVA